MAAVHHAADALAAVASADRETFRDAAASGRLSIPTRLPPAGDDIPYPYAPVPGQHVDTLLASYDNVITSTTGAARILDDLAAAIDPVRAAVLALVTVSLYGFWWWRDEPAAEGALGQPADPGRALAAVTVGWLALVPPFLSVHRTTTMIAAAQRSAAPG